MKSVWRGVRGQTMKRKGWTVQKGRPVEAIHGVAMEMRQEATCTTAQVQDVHRQLVEVTGGGVY